MPFEIGNQLGAKQRPVSDVISRIIKQDEAGTLDASRLRKGMELVFDAASTGDLQALTFIRDTVQGKPAQAIAIEDNNGQPLFTSIRMIVVKQDTNTINVLPTDVSVTHEL